MPLHLRLPALTWLSPDPSQSSLSELLRHSAESGLRRIVHVLFSRVHVLKDAVLSAVDP